MNRLLGCTAAVLLSHAAAQSATPSASVTPSMTPSSTATMTASPSAVPVWPLAVGVNTPGAVGAGQYVYYSVTIPIYPAFFSTLHVALMPRFGNPDLFLSANATRPSASAYGASSTNYIGTDVIDLSSRDRLSRAGCMRVTRPGAVCNFTIAVFGNDAAAYSIVVSMDGRSLPLTAGLPVVVSSAPGVFTYFSFGSVQIPGTPSSSSAPTPSSSASGTPSTTPSGSGTGTPTGSSAAGGGGSGSMTPTMSPTSSVTPSSSSGAANSSTVVPSPGPLPGSNVVFTLTSFSGMPALYVSSSALGSRALGKPTDAGVSSGGVCAFYDTATVTAEASAASGSSSIVGRIAIKPGDACFCAAPCTYYVGIGAATDYTQYSVVAVEGAPTAVINLLDGMPQDGSADSASPAMSPPSAFFDFEFVPATATSLAGPYDPLVTLSLDYFGSGSAMVYAIFEGSGPNPVHPLASSAYFHYAAPLVGGSAVITVMRTDTAYLNSCGTAGNSSAMCTMEILVLGVPVGSRPTASLAFTLTASTNRGRLLGDARSALSVGLGAGSTPRFFRYTATDPGDLVISATPISGAVDVFVSNAAVGGVGSAYPSATNGYLWRAVGASATGGSQAVVVRQTDAGSLACPLPCTYSIGVSASAGDSGSVAFRAMARVRTGVPVPLLEGEPLVDYAAPREYAFFSAVLPGSAGSITVTASLASSSAGTGDLQVFARGDGVLPDVYLGSYAVASPLLSSSAVELSLVLTRAMLPGCPNATASGGAGGFSLAPNAPCVISLLAYSVSGGVFTITAVAGSRFLQDGVAVTGVVPAGATQYYTFLAAAGASHVQLTLTSLAGTALALVSSSVSLPSASTPGVMSIGGPAGSSTLPLYASGCASAGAGLCAYYIGVRSYYAGSAAVYRLQGSSSTLAALTLAQPVSGHAGPSANGFSLFSVFVPSGLPSPGLSVVVQALSGGYLSIFVSNAVNPANNMTILPSPSCSFAPSPSAAPSPANASSSGSSGSAVSCDYTQSATLGWTAQALSAYSNKLAISGNDAAWVAGTTYVIAVSSPLETDFTLTAFSPGDALTLAAGSPITDFVSAPLLGATTIPSNFYRVLLPAGATAVSLQATPANGDVTLYASLSVLRPNASSANTRTAGIYQSYRIDFSASDIAAGCTPDPVTGLCSIYAAIVASPWAARGPVGYTLVATTAGAQVAPTRLLRGAVQDGALSAPGQWAYYAAVINITAGDVFYVNHVQSAGNAAVYISTDGSLPNATSYGATAAAALGVTYISVAPGSPAYITSGVLTVGVLALSPVTYTLAFGGSGVVMESAPGGTLQARLPIGATAYYTLRLGAVPGDVTAGVTALAGSVLMYGAQWLNPSRTLMWRPNAASNSWSGLGTNVITVPTTDGAACINCVLMFAIVCDSNPSTGNSPCSFLFTAGGSMGALPRLIDGVPVRTRIAAGGSPRYFFLGLPTGPITTILQATESTGQVIILVADAYAPSGGATPGLPTLSSPSSFNFSSFVGTPVLSLQQSEPVSSARAMHIYTVGAAAAPPGAATIFNLRSSAGINPLILLPGQQASGNALLAGQTQLFAFDMQDTTRDALVTLNLLYGRVLVAIASRGGTPACSVATDAVSGVRTPVCAAGSATWAINVSALTGAGAIRISALSPCANALTSAATNGSISGGGGCVPALDWTTGYYLLSVTAADDSAFSITESSSAVAIALQDGLSQDVTQASGGQIIPLLYQMNADPVNLPPVTFTFESTSASAPFHVYLLSCVTGACSVHSTSPDSTHHTASLHVITAGTRATLTISASGTPTAYCAGGSVLDVCSYYLTVIPDDALCATAGIAPCVAQLSVVATYQGSSAPVIMDYASIANNALSLPGVVTPSAYQLYSMYVKNDVLDVTSPVLVSVLLEACDDLIGYPQAFLCIDANSSWTTGRGVIGGANSGPVCAPPSRPSTSNYAVALDTSPFSPGGNGRGLVAGMTTSPRLYFSVMNPNIPPIRWIDRAAWLPSTYVVTVITGNALRLRPLSNASAGVITWAQSNSTQATISFDPVVVFNAAMAMATPGGWTNNSNIALGVTYRVYIARGGFVGNAQLVTNTSNNWVGIVTGTQCGLDRWASIVGRNATIATVTSPRNVSALTWVPAPALGAMLPSQLSVVVPNLTWGAYYEINVVAVCDAVCVRLNAAAYGLPSSSTGLSTLNVPYAIVGGTLVAAPAPAPFTVVESPVDPLTGALVPIGIVLAVIGIGAVCYIQHKSGKQRAAEAAAAAATANKGKLAGGGSGVQFDPILVGFGGPTREDTAAAAAAAVDAHPLSRARDPALRRAMSPQPINTTRAVSTGAAASGGEPSPVALLSHFGDASWAMTLVGPAEQQQTGQPDGGAGGAGFGAPSAAGVAAESAGSAPDSAVMVGMAPLATAPIASAAGGAGGVSASAASPTLDWGEAVPSSASASASDFEFSAISSNSNGDNATAVAAPLAPSAAPPAAEFATAWP